MKHNLSVNDRPQASLVIAVDELSNPETVVVFSAGTEVLATADDGNLVEQAWWRGLTP